MSSLSPGGMPLTVVLSQIFFNLTTLFSYPVFFSLFHAPLDVDVHFLVFLRSFRLKSFLSQFSLFVEQILKIVFYQNSTRFSAVTKQELKRSAFFYCLFVVARVATSPGLSKFGC